MTRASLGRERPLRVLRLISHLGSGGTERQCAEILRCHARVNDPEVELELATYWARPHLHALPESIVWHRLDARPDPRGLGRLGLALRTLLRERDYDCVHALLWPSAALVFPLLPRRCALLTSIHSSAIRRRPGKSLLLRAIGRRSQRLLFNSEAGREALAADFGVHPSAVAVIPNGVPLSGPLDLAALRTRRGVVCVARAVPSKRHDLLLDAWARLPSPLAGGLTLIGRGSEALLAERPEVREVRALGELPDPERELARAAIAVLPTAHEGLPNAVLEAWAQGSAVLASDAPGVRELVRHGEDGWLVPNEIGAWQEALTRLDADADLRVHLATRGHARARDEFGLERALTRWIGAYREAVQARRS